MCRDSGRKIGNDNARHRNRPHVPDITTHVPDITIAEFQGASHAKVPTAPADPPPLSEQLIVQ